MEPESPFLPGAGADPIWSESAPGPQTSGAALKWRLRNTGKNNYNNFYIFGYLIFEYAFIVWAQTIKKIMQKSEIEN